MINKVKVANKGAWVSQIQYLCGNLFDVQFYLQLTPYIGRHRLLLRHQILHLLPTNGRCSRSHWFSPSLFSSRGLLVVAKATPIWDDLLAVGFCFVFWFWELIPCLMNLNILFVRRSLFVWLYELLSTYMFLFWGNWKKGRQCVNEIWS